MIIQAAVTHNDFKRFIKDYLQYLNKPTSCVNEAMVLKIFGHYPFIKSLML